MLDGILSPEAARLYDELRRGATVLSEPERATPDTASPMQELRRNGLVKETFDDPPRLVALEPRAAIAASVTQLIDQISDRHRALTHTIDEALHLNSDDAVDQGVRAIRLLTDPGEINFLSSALVEGARSEARFLNTADASNTENVEAVGLSAKQLKQGVTLRSVYDVGFVPGMSHIIETSVANGEEARISDGVPIKMIMVDRRQVMLPVDRTGTRGAVLVEAPPIVNALDLLFEFIWDRAIPYGASDEVIGLTPIERRVLTLLATGSKDEAIAQRLNVTVRTVRRHITSAMTKLGAENRFAAGVLAARRGWI